MDFVINEQILMITKVRLHSQLTETHNRDIIVVVILNVVAVLYNILYGSTQSWMNFQKHPI